MNGTANPTRIHRLRVRVPAAAGGSRPGLRSRVTRLFDAADLRPPNIPPAAILIVRRLVDPLPRRLLRSGPFGGPALPDPAWERAARAALARCYQDAARPARGTVPAGANAVAFADDGELLACLARDAARGDVAGRWWWESVVNTRGGRAINPAGVFIDRPRAVPAAFARLVAWGDAPQVLRAMPPGRAAAVLAAVAAAYRVGPFQPPAPPPPKTRSPDVPVPAAGNSDEDEPAAAARPRLARGERLPAWVEGVFAVAAAGRLGPERERLLAVAALLHRDPAAVSLPAVRAALSAGPTRYLAARSAEVAGPPGAPPGHPAAAPPPTAPRRPAPSPRSAEAPGPPTRGASARRGSPEPPPDDCAVAAPAAGWSAGEDGIVTELGGALFLANVLGPLGMPGCFDPGWGLSADPGAWGVLEALARGLLADADTALAADPLWDVLAPLGGREPGQILGEAVPVPAAFDLPPAWVVALGREVGSFAYAVVAGRMRVLSDAGYVLADHPATIAPAEQARALLRAYFASADRHVPDLPGESFDGSGPPGTSNPFTAPLGPGLRRWLSFVLPYVRLRLTRALGPGTEIVSGVLLRRGRVYATGTHVDLVLPPSAVSVAVRRAGLDRDPGWVPELGRVVRTHFE